MSSRTHLWLRISAVVLLVGVAMWPRAKAGTTAAELAAIRATHGVAARAETTAAKLISPPRTTKMVVADADESQLTN